MRPHHGFGVDVGLVVKLIVGVGVGEPPPPPPPSPFPVPLPVPFPNAQLTNMGAGGPSAVQLFTAPSSQGFDAVVQPTVQLASVHTVVVTVD